MKIIDIYDTLYNDNIFNYINTNKGTKLSWLTSDTIGPLNDEYYLLHSGDKELSILYNRLIDIVSTNTLALTRISKIIINKYADSWDRLYSALFADYNPIENYSMIEHENVGTNLSNINTQNNNVYGFNTTDTDGEPLGKTSGTITTTGDFDDNVRELTRSGNIGVTTSQQMIQSEIELRNNINNFYNIIFNDIDTILCNNLYA